MRQHQATRATRFSARRAWTVATLGCTVALWAGCSGKKQTELVAGVSSQVQVPRDLRSIRVDVNGAFGNQFCRTYPVYDGKVRLPRTLGVVSAGNPNAPVTITVSGYPDDAQSGDVAAFNDCGAIPAVGTKTRDRASGGGARVLRRARQPYVDGKILYVPMPLRYSCFDVDCEQDKSPQCSAGDCTCRGGKCVAPDLDARALSIYSDDLVFGSSNTCFRPFATTDESGAVTPGCLDDGVPPQVVDAAKCIYVLPGTPSATGLPAYDAGLPLPDPPTHGAGLNVRVVYDDVVSEVLDYEGACPPSGTGPIEGYCTPDPSKPQMFQIADGICHNPVHKLTLLTSSGLCPSKTELQPICDESIQGTPQPTLLDGGTSTDGGCNVAQALVPAPSALYVMMDKSSGMRNFFGSQGLSQVIGLPLQDPVFVTTQIGFKYLPDVAASCTTASPFGNAASLDVKLEPAFTAQADIAALLGSTTALATSPPLYLDAALEPLNGAYKVLRDKKAAGAGSLYYNRLAVMLILDRDVVADCGGSRATPQAEAQTALQSDGIYTYVVMLGNEDLVDASNGIPPLESAKALASAGGTTLFDVTHGEGATAQARQADLARRQGDALNTIVTDLGSCLYDAPKALSTLAHVGYTGQTGPVDLSYATDCSGADKNHWTFDQGRIRLCETPCDDLRVVLKATALAAEAAGQTPPAVPVTATEPCDPTTTPPPVGDGSPPPPAPITDAGGG